MRGGLLTFRGGEEAGTRVAVKRSEFAGIDLNPCYITFGIRHLINLPELMVRK